MQQLLLCQCVNTKFIIIVILNGNGLNRHFTRFCLEVVLGLGAEKSRLELTCYTLVVVKTWIFKLHVKIVCLQDSSQQPQWNETLTQRDAKEKYEVTTYCFKRLKMATETQTDLKCRALGSTMNSLQFFYSLPDTIVFYCQHDRLAGAWLRSLMSFVTL